MWPVRGWSPGVRLDKGDEPYDKRVDRWKGEGRPVMSLQKRDPAEGSVGSIMTLLGCEGER